MSVYPPYKKIKLSEMASSTTGETMTLDDKSLNLFSRQNAALGAETTAKLIKMKVAIYGLRAVGIETAKNLALQGAGAITLIDPTPADVKDIGANFFIYHNDIGKPRNKVSAPKLKELNPICIVNTVDVLDEAVIESHSVVVVTQVLPLPQLLHLNELCRKHKVSFFYTYTSGVSLDIFVDHGPDHIVNDFTGEKPIQKIITEITPVSTTTTLIRYDTPEGQLPIALTSGYFEVTEVEGIEEINNRLYPITHEDSDPAKTIKIEFGIPNGAKYVSGGLLTEKKVPTKYPMESLASKLKNPGDTFSEPPTLVLTDLINFGSETQQHIAFYAVHSFFTENGRLPAICDENDSIAVAAIAKKLLSDGSIALDGFDIDEDYIKKYANFAASELQPMAAFAGGVLAQEVVKSTGKFTPIPGFMHFAANEALPTAAIDPSDRVPKGTQYDELASVYGWPFVEKLGSLKYFMVGCGALGCEFMKNFALNGVCCGPNGKLFVTDADRIELSNLSRQFLFREHNVGHPKSKAAAAMAKIMNKNFNVEAMEMFVGPKTEDTFNDAFWMSLDGVCNALDNMEARLYVDAQCVKYEKPLLESGTMGTSGNVDTIVPFKTRTYADGGNAAEGGGVPMCTLRNFPHLTDHCIEWSRDQFELLFVKLPKSLENYLNDPALFEQKIREKAASEAGAAFFDIRSVTSFANLVANPSIGNAAQLAFDLFHFLFRDRILDLQAAFPLDSRVIDKNTGIDKGPFWGEKKRYPTVATFNPNDEVHTEFILSCTCLFSVMVGLIPPKDENDSEWLQEYRSSDWVVQMVSNLSPPAYVQAPVTSADLDDAPEMDKSILEGMLQNMCNDLKQLADKIQKLPNFELADFEKDDDMNFHIAFTTATANLRCDNYSIKRTDFHSCKIIAGKIIAAIATTTAAVCGLVLFELFKVILEKDTDAFMNRAIGLAGFTYTSFTQEPPYKFSTRTELEVPNPTDPLPDDAYDHTGKLKDEYITKIVKRAYPEGHSVWNKIICQASMTLKQFQEWLADEHKLKLQSWDFIYGKKSVTDESKEKRTQGVSTPIFPPKPKLDYSLLPSLDLTLAQATMAIMKVPAAKPTQQYLALWKQCKQDGIIPDGPQDSDNAITMDTTLKEILLKMAKMGEEATKKQLIDTATVSSLDGKLFYLIHGSESPICCDIDTEEAVENLCSIKIML